MDMMPLRGSFFLRIYITMISRFFNLLYGSTSVQFESQYPLDESVSRLAGKVKPATLFNFSEQCAVGTVTEKRVSICRKIPFVRNSWKPCFVGAFELDGDKTILKGQFGFSSSTKISMSFYFGIIILWTMFAAVSVASESLTDLYFPLAGVALFGVATAGMISGKRSARKDVDWLSTRISDALQTHSDGM